MLEQRFEIGTRFWSHGKHSKLCTVVDVLRTYNSAGELVRLRYVAEHMGPLGHTITDHDVLDTSIARRLADAIPVNV